MIQGVLLAAGASTRFGADKLRQRLPDGRVIAGASAANLKAAVPRVLAVVRQGGEELAAILEASGCTVVYCERAREGMGESLACAIRATDAASGWLVALADMPWIRPETNARLAGMLADRGGIVAPIHQGLRGHPVGFDRTYLHALSALAGDRGARDVIKLNDGALRLLETDDPGVLQDIDTPLDLELHLGTLS